MMMFVSVNLLLLLVFGKSLNIQKVAICSSSYSSFSYQSASDDEDP